MTDTLEQLKALAELREKATPGPWVSGALGASHIISGLNYNVCDVFQGSPSAKKRASNTAFIAAAGSLDFAAIAQELERLRAKVEDLTEHNAQLQSLEVLRQMADNAGCNPPETD